MFNENYEVLPSKDQVEYVSKRFDAFIKRQVDVNKIPNDVVLISLLKLMGEKFCLRGVAIDLDVSIKEGLPPFSEGYIETAKGAQDNG